NEVSEGRGSPHGGAFLDIASQRPDEYIKKKLPSMHEQFIELAEVDITNDPMEVGPTLHYFMGGIRVDPDTQASTVPGLFACGEAAAGLHGANRLGGNSLSDLMVFGRLAGQGVADYVQELSETPEVHDDQVGEIVDDAKAFLEREEGENPFMIHEDLQDLMQECVGILRTEDELEEALEGLEDLKGRLDNAKAHPTSQFNAGWHKALDLQSLIEMAQAVASAALEREESRGAHTRLDFEGEREEWGEVNILVRKEDGELVIDHYDRPEPPEELAEIGYASLEELEQGDV
ncbi:MAG: FAD-binding protein, partial [Bradymonadaceae bacterium]